MFELDNDDLTNIVINGDLKADDDDSPFPRLVVEEVRRLIRSGHMSRNEADVFRFYVCSGMKVREIGAIYGKSNGWVWKTLQTAIKKIEHAPNVGLLTVLIEEFGKKAVDDARWYEELRDCMRVFTVKTKPAKPRKK